MNRARAKPLLIALLCISALGVAATTLESSLTTDPDEEISPDWDNLPIGESTAAAIQDEMGDGGGADEPEDGDDDGSEDDAGADGGTSGGEESGQDLDGDGTDHDGDTGGDQSRDAEHDDSALEGGTESGNHGTGSPEDPGGDGDPEHDGGSGDTDAQAPGESGQGDEQDREGGPGMDAGTGEPTLFDRLLALLAAIFKVLVALVALLGLVSGTLHYREQLLAMVGLESIDAAEPEPPADDADDEPAPWPLAGPSNVVDEAWVAAVRSVDPERPETATPAECADLAREASVDAEAVEAIARAFERVHYGGVPATEETDRARDGLDRLRGGAGR